MIQRPNGFHDMANEFPQLDTYTDSQLQGCITSTLDKLPEIRDQKGICLYDYCSSRLKSHVGRDGSSTCMIDWSQIVLSLASRHALLWVVCAESHKVRKHYQCRNHRLPRPSPTPLARVDHVTPSSPIFSSPLTPLISKPSSFACSSPPSLTLRTKTPNIARFSSLLLVTLPDPCPRLPQLLPLPSLLPLACSESLEGLR